MANANYAPITATTAYSGMAYIAEQQEGSWKKSTQYDQSYPTLEEFMHGGSAPIEAVTAKSVKMIMPVHLGAMVVADFVGVTRANEANAVAAATASNSTQAEVVLAGYWSRSVRFTDAEIEFAYGQAQNGGIRNNVVWQRHEEIRDIAMQRLCTDLWDSGDAGQDSVMAVNFAIATGNTVHGIDQSAQANWRGNVDTAGGAFDLIKFQQHLQILRRQRGANPNLAVFAAPSGGTDLYVRAINLLGENVQVMTKQDQSGTLQRGFQAFIYDGVKFIRDHWATAGTMLLTDTKSWIWGGDKQPSFYKKLAPLPSTPSVESMLKMRCSLGCSSPRKSYRWTGLTG